MILASIASRDNAAPLVSSVILAVLATPTSGTDPPGGTLGVGGYVSADFQNNKDGGHEEVGMPPRKGGQINNPLYASEETHRGLWRECGRHII